uniref:Intraflagellar transport protein 140 homolog n=1 Tax=Romanomermis culicivorax TaxID=13658 RepID=A0A915J6M4_ROMCU
MLDIEHEENVLLALTADKGYSGSDSINCIAYCSTSGIVAAGTQLGKLALWKPVARNSHNQSYTLISASAFQHSISSIQWSCGFNCLSAYAMNDIFVLKERSLLTQFAENHLVVQSDQHTLQLTRLEPPTTVECKITDHPPKALRIWPPFVACFDGGRFSVYEMTDSMDGGIVVVGSFDVLVGQQQQSDRELKLSRDEDDVHNESGQLADFALHSSGLYLTDKARIQVKTFQGTLKQSLPLADEEKDPCLLNVHGHFLVVATISGFLRIYDLSRREAKSICSTKFAAENISHFAAFATLKINCNGTKVTFTVKKIEGILDQSLYAWDVENDQILEYNFKESMPDLYAKNHFWDLEDPRYLVAEAAYISEEINDCSTIATFFVTNDSSILLHDSFRMSSICDRLMGLAVPFMYFLKTSDHSSTGDCSSIDGSSTNNRASMLEMSDLERLSTKHVVRRTCRDFIGLEDMNKEMKTAMLDFSYHLTVGNMDEAFKAVKLIKSESVWENMAQMCVKTGRLDVAAICLGNMGNARAARNLRKGLMNQNPNNLSENAKNEILGRLAVDLGMKEDAFRIYSTSSNPHLVNKLYRAQNDWKKVVTILYEKAETHSYNVPLMLLNNIEALRRYVDEKKDKKLYKWWAQYCESLQELEQAKKYYNLAKDYLSIVRLLCFTGEISEATKVANESNDKAACYHLARQCENKGQYKEAVHYFTKACAYGSAIRLCKEHEMHERIAQLALLGTDSDMIEAAKFYENRPGHTDKAVMLFHKVGMYGRALDLAFRTEQFSALDLIVADLNEKSDPRVLERCAEFFAQNQQYTKAVQFLGYAKKAMKALLKSGDTSKIIFFANTARQKEIYLMAGNYLQSLDWKNDAQVMKNIVQFYTKGQAPRSLSGFYDACAQVEIDEYKDYDKALVAMQEAAKCLATLKSENLDDQSSPLNKRIDTIKRFLNIRRIYDTDPVEAVNQLQQMTQETDVDSAVRLGDLFSVLIIHNVKKDNYKKAMSYLQELKKRAPNLDLSKYLKKQLIEKIYDKNETKFGDENVATKSSILETDTDSLEATTVPESKVLQRRKYDDLDLDNF